jgi:hypothetical protein
VRGSTIVITLSFEALKPYLGTIEAVQVVGLACYAVAFVGLYALRETFHADLNFVEQRGAVNTDEIERSDFVVNG